ncbi:inositol monophosphatase [Patescibacteria group bacterium]|nr:inositol monophosphatase [Patescibacteria group bacterium]
MNPKYKNIIRAVEKSGEIVLSYFGKSIKTESKGMPLNFVTAADLKSEKNLIRAVEKEFPKYNIQSEEAGFIDKKSDYTFVMDPLDGTINLKIGIPYFSVTMALLKGDETVFTVINNPVTKQTFYAEKGKGTFLNGKRARVNGVKNLEDCVAAYSCGWQTPRARSINLKKKIHGIGIKRILANWAPVYDFCLLASGKIETMICYNNELHDFVGGLLLVREAGGKITDFKGKPLKNDRVNTFLMTNGTSIHNKIINVLKK